MASEVDDVDGRDDLLQAREELLKGLLSWNGLANATIEEIARVNYVLCTLSVAEDFKDICPEVLSQLSAKAEELLTSATRKIDAALEEAETEGKVIPFRRS